MIGAYRPDMREMDDDCLLKAKVYVDNTATAIKETGDLAIPLAQGVIDKAHVLAHLFALCRQPKTISRDENDITLFKSVGHALEDLAAAKVVYRFVTSQQ